MNPTNQLLHNIYQAAKGLLTKRNPYHYVCDALYDSEPIIENEEEQIKLEEYKGLAIFYFRERFSPFKTPATCLGYWLLDDKESRLNALDEMINLCKSNHFTP